MFEDRLIRASEIAIALGLSKRTLATMIDEGRFPKPDRAASRLGEPHMWLESTARAGIAAYVSERRPRRPTAEQPREGGHYAAAARGQKPTP